MATQAQTGCRAAPKAQLPSPDTGGEERAQVKKSLQDDWSKWVAELSERDLNRHRRNEALMATTKVNTTSHSQAGMIEIAEMQARHAQFAADTAMMAASLARDHAVGSAMLPFEPDDQAASEGGSEGAIDMLSDDDDEAPEPAAAAAEEEPAEDAESPIALLSSDDDEAGGVETEKESTASDMSEEDAAEDVDLDTPGWCALTACVQRKDLTTTRR